MQRTLLWSITLGAAAAVSLGVAVAQRATASSAVAHGRQLFVADGCPQCHGHVGEGGVGPRIAPSPMPIESFTHQLRHPAGVMAVYSVAVLSDADLKDIYAYLSSIPQAKTVAELPLLNQ